MTTNLSTQTLYDQDYYLWLENTVEQLRLCKAHCRRQSQEFKQLDLDNLIEEIESLGREQKHKVESYLRQLLKHLLLYQYWEAEKAYCTTGWASEIDNFRAELEILLRSRTLYNFLVSILEPTYAKARRAACLKSQLQIFPKSCPYTIEQILNPDWFPDS